MNLFNLLTTPAKIGALSLLGMLWYSCGQQPNSGQQQSGAKPYPVVEVPRKTVTSYISFPASVEGTTNSPVRAKVSGYITDVLVDEGENVKKGQLLFKLETQSLSEDAEAAKATVNAAQVEVDKLKPLVEKEIISEMQLETAKAQLAQAKSNYNSITANIGYANIKSPIDGFVGAIPNRVGTLVSPNDQTSLTTVSETEEVYVFFSMNEKEYLDFLQHTPGKTRQDKVNNFPEVRLKLVNGSIYDQKGRIQTVTGQVDQQTGSVSFRALFSNPEGILTNGNSAIIQIPEVFENVLVIPGASTYELQNKVFVYKVQGDSIALSTPVEVQKRVEQLIVVESGLSEGEKIVAKGVVNLSDGAPIIPQPSSFDSLATQVKPLFK